MPAVIKPYGRTVNPVSLAVLWLPYSCEVLSSNKAMGKGREGREEEVLGHLFWRKLAKSGHDNCMGNLLQFISLFWGFLFFTIFGCRFLHVLRDRDWKREIGANTPVWNKGQREHQRCRLPHSMAETRFILASKSFRQVYLLFTHFCNMLFICFAVIREIIKGL